MKKQAGIWLVVVFLMAVLGIVYALSTHPSSTKADNVGVAVPQAPPPPAAEVSLSPDLKHTDAYELLDPVPVGKAAPNFSVKTAEGKPIQLNSFKGKKNVVLVFYQGSFCTVCGAQLTNLQSHLSDFRNQDAEIIAISADDEQHAMQSVGEHGLTFNVVPDQGKKLIKQFGVANVSKDGIAWPSMFVVDKKGIIRLSYADRDGHRLHSNEVLPVLSKLTGKSAPSLSYDN
jgi:peroxiredoxin